MSKFQQLVNFRQWKIPTPAFTNIQYEDFKTGKWSAKGLAFPLAVRSSFSEEDGQQFSHAGEFQTCLNVAQQDLVPAIEKVFDSYPDSNNAIVILQEMVQAEYSGVLFAFRRGIWKLEIGSGIGEAIVGGQYTPDTLILPKFNRRDQWMSKWQGFWRLPEKYRSLMHPLVSLSYYAGKLLEKETEAVVGLDIEWAIFEGRIYLLQARPITTPDEEEEILTTANHREILPPKPSRLMTEVISTSGEELFDYYRDLDPQLKERSFILTAEGMPWINLSALLDMMVEWGLPSHLVVKSIGAEDFYRLGLRPHQAIRKIGVFFKALRQQMFSQSTVRKWIAHLNDQVLEEQNGRLPLWKDQPEKAFDAWFDSFRRLYVDLVQHMQLLTGAMSGPLSVLDRLGLLPQLAAAMKAKSQSTDYYAAFQEMMDGHLSRAAFIEQYGHRGFYESDIGQARFIEWSEEDWEVLLKGKGSKNQSSKRGASSISKVGAILFRPLFKAVHLRETVRHELMKQFWVYRKELLDHWEGMGFADIQPWRYKRAQLYNFFSGEISKEDLLSIPEVVQSGWDKNTFLLNKNGRRMDLPALYRDQDEPSKPRAGIGIYPGRVRGQVWRVREAGLSNLERPDFAKVILVADALDPGWVPYFSQVDGVLAYVGGLLSHASIILRESAVPAITQLPASLDLQTGDWIEMDGKSGEVTFVDGGKQMAGGGD